MLSCTHICLRCPVCGVTHDLQDGGSGLFGSVRSILSATMAWFRSMLAWVMQKLGHEGDTDGSVARAEAIQVGHTVFWLVVVVCVPLS